MRQRVKDIAIVLAVLVALALAQGLISMVR
jgi:hypothetical protein